MMRGNFLGAIVAIIYTVYISAHPFPTKSQMAFLLVVLNALTIILMTLAFKHELEYNTGSHSQHVAMRRVVFM
ncbi:MAG: hypothetical protein KGI50_04045 [Patescibacteria group bacterium]|nr:hypothetical protein [Patescibacteria group bacterium]MDE2438859.1 hypothetical protein [Patescibacteria group bacterium]